MSSLLAYGLVPLFFIFGLVLQGCEQEPTWQESYAATEPVGGDSCPEPTSDTAKAVPPPKMCSVAVRVTRAYVGRCKSVSSTDIYTWNAPAIFAQAATVTKDRFASATVEGLPKVAAIGVAIDKEEAVAKTTRMVFNGIARVTYPCESFPNHRDACQPVFAHFEEMMKQNGNMASRYLKEFCGKFGNGLSTGAIKPFEYACDPITVQ